MTVIYDSPRKRKKKEALREESQGVPLAERLAWSVDQLAQLTSLGRTSLYALMSQNLLAFYKAGSRRFITAEAWKKCLECLSAKESK